MGATAAYRVSVFSLSSRKANPQNCLFLLKLSVPLFKVISLYFNHVKIDSNYVALLVPLAVFRSRWIAVVSEFSIVYGPASVCVWKGLSKIAMVVNLFDVHILHRNANLYETPLINKQLEVVTLTWRERLPWYWDIRTMLPNTLLNPDPSIALHFKSSSERASFPLRFLSFH